MVQFDVAISFAGEDRAVAHEIAFALRDKHGLQVFYDDYAQAALLGETLTEYLIDIYKNQATYCVVLVSKHYREKRWTTHEWRAAQARAFEQFDRPYILPVRLDDTELPGLLPTTGYISFSKLGLDGTVELIIEKAGGELETSKLIRLAQDAYTKGDIDRAAEIISSRRFDHSFDALMVRGDIYLKQRHANQAIEVYQKAHLIRPTEFLPLFLLGISCFRAMKFDEAVQYYEAAARLEPTHITVISDLRSAKRWAARMKHPVKSLWYGRPWQRFLRSIENDETIESRDPVRPK